MMTRVWLASEDGIRGLDILFRNLFSLILGLNKATNSLFAD